VDPLGDPLAHILAVGAEHHFAMLFQRFQGDDCRHHLHAVIGGEVIALLKFFRAGDSAKSRHNRRAWIPRQEPSVKISTCLSISGRLPVIEIDCKR
jgi:hypothetical protein